MREILFRGKILDTNSFHYVDWCYGSLVYSSSEDQYYIVEHCDEECSFPVDKETIRQYTGLKDKNGTKIFEGDIVKFTDYDSYDYECFETGGVIKYGGNMFYVTNRHNVGMEDLVDDLENTMECEVIGNIYDNPEILEVAE